MVCLIQTARNLSVTLDDQLSFAASIAATARSCRFILHNIRRIHLFLAQEAVQVLVQALVISRLDYYNSLLSGAPARTIQPLQLIQNATRVVFNLPKFPDTTPLLRSLHSTVLWMAQAHPTSRTWLNITPQLVHYTLLLPNSLLHSHHSTKSRLSAVLPPQWWNELPIDRNSAETLHTFCHWLKTHLFRRHLGTWRKTKKQNFQSLLLL